jgi:lysozyme family protein
VSDFKAAILTVLVNEGGYSNNPDDAGRETKYGISKKAYPDLDIKSITIEQAKAIYERDYWTAHGICLLQSQRVATKVLDAAVNIGAVTAIRILQDALDYLLAGPIISDGKLGNFTASAASHVPDEQLLPELRARLAKHHVELNQPEFLLGWLRRDAQ